MTTSTFAHRGTTIETITVLAGTRGSTAGMTGRHESHLAMHPPGLTDAPPNRNSLIDNQIADTLYEVRRISDIRTVVPLTIDTSTVDLPIATPQHAKMSARLQM